MVAISAIWSPVRAMETVARERRIAAGFGVVALAAIFGLISSVISVFSGAATSQINPQDFPEVPPDVLNNIATAFQVGLPIVMMISPFVWWLIVTLVMQLITRFFGGSGSISAMFATMGVAYVPSLISAAIGIPVAGILAVVGSQGVIATIIGLVNFVLSLGFLVWYVALVIIGASFAREITYGQSGGSCAISCVGCGGLVLVAAIALVVIGVTVSSSGAGG